MQTNTHVIAQRYAYATRIPLGTFEVFVLSPDLYQATGNRSDLPDTFCAAGQMCGSGSEFLDYFSEAQLQAAEADQKRVESYKKATQAPCHAHSN